ncbi:MAG: mannose-1-phosphate guanylyltransferase [Planctomycetota bacterium]
MILAGGSGTRFWPLSRSGRPKQLLPLLGGRTLLERTAERFAGLSTPTRLWVVTGTALGASTAAALPELGDRLLLEPEPRDTAPAVCLAAARLLALDGEDSVQCLAPADHLIEPVEAFRAALEAGVARVRDSGRLLVFGARPTFAATGYGYIETGAAAAPARDPTGVEHEVREVARFVEKPDRATAEALLAAGGHLWNCGLFLWRVGDLLLELGRHARELHEGTLRMAAGFRAGDRDVVDAAFRALPRTSIDFALLERSDAVDVLPIDFAWDDVGSFASVAAHLPPDEAGNASGLPAGSLLVCEDAADNVVLADEATTVALLGVRGLAVVRAADALLVCPKDRVEEVKRLVQRLAGLGRSDLL